MFLSSSTDLLERRSKKRQDFSFLKGSAGGSVMPADDEDDSGNAANVGNGDRPELLLDGTSDEKALPNGDRYVGALVGNLPEGRGKYVWANGSWYEGQWEKGKKSGRGKFVWPSGAFYEGEFAGGFMQGLGNFRAPNGAVYKGNWSMNLKHGLGRLRYANGDKYEGAWKHGLQDGFGKYVWTNKNVYVGDWKAGVMTGKGVLRWGMGDAFNGEWLNGMEHGRGVYYWADGSIFVGTWSRGLKDGKGVFYPAGTLPLDMSTRENLMLNKVEEYLATGIAKDWTSVGSWKNGRRELDSRFITSSGSGNLDQQIKKNVWLGRRWSLEGPLERVLGLESFFIGGEAILEEEKDDVPEVAPILEREYAQGVLINEIVKQPIGSVLSKSSRRKRRRQPREPKRPGETIFKGHRSYDLMLTLQIGIRYTVGKVTPEPCNNIGPLDFGSKASVRMKFPKMGSQVTPCHRTVDFAWKDYCPRVFKRLREMFKIDAADYMLSICGNSALRELPSPGKSGSVFFLSNDDRFMIKTMRKSEVKVLLRMLRSYYNHVSSYDNTLITKFFGLHRVKPQGGQKVRFVVMGNMFCTDLRIHRRYDLKGSLQGRCTGEADIDENTTLKDLDLDYVFHLEPSWRDALIKQIASDCKFLESQHIMDYSLLLGLHFRAPHFYQPSKGTIPDGEEEWTPARSLVLVPRDQGKRTMSSHIRGKPLTAAGIAEADDNAEVDLLLPGTARLQIQLGVNMPARADRKPRKKEENNDEEESLDEVHDVVLYLGVIDILQEYDVGKRIEHAYKSLQFDPVSISAIEPASYSQRFQDFVCKIFPSNDSNG
ncbi:hypothetical protein SELMODRAFT_449262 [Selaginella moellendorffii]|uniref:Phosphatidylinositol 4-phosphate 5-kinase n=1 Tax=Selaginella moellendorffii TaxID=88036 RepID=D8TEF7_SELML|nr:phosphatidylinositol 4-phosphate 5-kinase 9 [Selaginella moellendorffii]EFJ04955.1 hypothetical protein SELMODRAFT_449262 [Selaginella moellendorffii]|eukprot:XP_002993971.1 phosphatidylinositol 4-phosphate 5-kinase 9 [Selaginella moellendorffii]